ncbi:MAG TPA: efflux RND transporter periplasmic adaptor subunit [Candidatus Polarisedimenticolia bacterium]
MKRWTKVAIGAAVGAAALAGGAAFYGRKDAGLLRVTVEEARVKDLRSRVTCNGKIQAKKKVDLSATMSGQIVNLAVREGDRVTKGEFLLQIDRTTLQAQADSTRAALEALLSDRDAARANAERTRLEYEQTKRSYESGIVSELENTRARTQYEAQKATHEAVERRIEQARASFVGARDTLLKTTITSPMDGVITRLQIEEGEVAMIGTMNNPGTALMTISDLSVIEAEMEVDETEIPSVKVGQTATMKIDAYGEREFGGVVTEIASSPLVVPTPSGPAVTAVDFKVKVRVEDPPPDLRPGLSCTADILTATRSQVLAVPIQALVLREKPGADSRGGRESEEEGVFVLAAGAAAFRPVKTGITGDLEIEVIEGVSSGEQVITGPFKTLRVLKEGDRASVQKEAGTPP